MYEISNFCTDSSFYNGRKDLFLLEVMIKKVAIDADVLLQSFTFNPNKIRGLDITAKVKFSNVYSMEIDSSCSVQTGLVRNRCLAISPTTDLDDTASINSRTDNNENSIFPNVQGGKSCLFPTSTRQLIEEMHSSPLYVDLFTKDDTAMFLGKTKFYLGSNFIDTVANSPSCTELPISAFLKSTLPIKTMFGDVAGRIEIYVRLTCFGKSILSDFSFAGPEGCKTVRMKERCYEGGQMYYR